MIVWTTGCSSTGHGSVMTIDIVIAKYNEDVEWGFELHKRNPEFKIIIYDKAPETIISPLDNENIKINALPNIGRESETYLYHIIENYDNLADFTFFTQADPHEWDTATFFNVIDNVGAVSIKYGGFITSRIPWFDSCCDETARPHERDGLPLVLFYETFLTTIKITPPYKFIAGACFFVSKKNILRNSKKFYESLHKAHFDSRWTLNQYKNRGNLVPWILERFWYYIFTHHPI